jgi:hypothetical protein
MSVMAMLRQLSRKRRIIAAPGARMTRMLSYLVVAFSGAILLAQSATTATPPAQVHISGAVRQCGKPVGARGGWWVIFEGPSPLSPKSVKANDNGVYETDLPFGVWTMTLRASPDDTTSFARPRHFQVNASGKLVLDIYIRPPIACSVRGTPEQTAAACWGEEFYEVPSGVPLEVAGAPLEVDLFGRPNQYWTPCSMVEGKGRHREFATYNLLSIEADNVAYHPSEKILEASGDVLMQDESGEHKANSVRLRLQDGQVSALPTDR